LSTTRTTRSWRVSRHMLKTCYASVTFANVLIVSTRHSAHVAQADSAQHNAARVIVRHQPLSCHSAFIRLIYPLQPCRVHNSASCAPWST
jgi:hypothetical protein